MDFASRLLLLLEVKELGTFAKVSDHRNVDRSVISKQIAKLEDELGVRVLNRTTRSLSLTAAGNEIIHQASTLRTLLSDTKRIAQNYHSEPKGKLKITSASQFGRMYVQPAIIEFQRRFPQLEVELRLDDRVVDMVGEGYDIGFRFGDPKDSTLIARKLARNKLAIVASPDFIERYGMPETVAELASLPCAVYSNDGLVVDNLHYLNEKDEPKTLSLKSSFKVNDPEMLVDAATSGNVYSVISVAMLKNQVLDGTLIPIMTDLRLLDYGALYAVYPHRDSPIKTRLFIEAMKEVIGGKEPVWERLVPNLSTLYGNDKRPQQALL